jgi:hypothetical protein
MFLAGFPGKCRRVCGFCRPWPRRVLLRPRDFLTVSVWSQTSGEGKADGGSTQHSFEPPIRNGQISYNSAHKWLQFRKRRASAFRSLQKHAKERRFCPAGWLYAAAVRVIMHNLSEEASVRYRSDTGFHKVLTVKLLSRSLGVLRTFYERRTLLILMIRKGIQLDYDQCLCE